VLQHLDDLASRRPRRSKAGHAQQHAVAVQNAVHFLGRQIEVVATLFRNHEAEAVGMPLDAALDRSACPAGKLALAVEHQLAVALHRLETALEQGRARRR